MTLTYRASTNADLVRRCHAIVLSAWGHAISTIAPLFRVDQGVIHRWLDRFEAGDWRPSRPKSAKLWMLTRTTFWCKRTTVPVPRAAAGCAMGMLAMDAMGMRAMAGALVRARMEPAPMALLPRTRTALHSAMRCQRRESISLIWFLLPFGD
jgi:hypothetical protein